MEVEIAHDEVDERYEALVDGTLAGFAQYRVREGGARAFIHTEVEVAYEGQGIGSRLVRGALDDARASGAGVLPYCSFVKTFIERNEEYRDLVPAEARAEFDL